MILVVVKDSTNNILSFIYKTPQELPRVTMTQPLMQESPKHIMDATPQMSILLLFFTTEPGHSRTIQATVSKIIQDLIWRMKIQLVTSSNVLVRHSISRNSHSIILGRAGKEVQVFLRWITYFNEKWLSWWHLFYSLVNGLQNRNLQLMNHIDERSSDVEDNFDE